MGKVFNVSDEAFPFLPNDNARNDIPRVRFRREVFDVPVVTNHHEKGVFRLKFFQESAQQTVKSLKDVHRSCHIPAVTCVVGEPIFKKGEIVV